MYKDNGVSEISSVGLQADHGREALVTGDRQIGCLRSTFQIQRGMGWWFYSKLKRISLDESEQIRGSQAFPYPILNFCKRTIL